VQNEFLELTYVDGKPNKLKVLLVVKQFEQKKKGLNFEKMFTFMT
jgi:hypothetical protein